MADYCPIIIEFPPTEVSNGLMHKLKEFECPLFDMSMEIERVKIGRSSRNYGIVMKPVLTSSSRNFIKASKKETEILAEARRCCVLKNPANPIDKRVNICGFPSNHRIFL
jgi:hypothetical protein